MFHKKFILKSYAVWSDWWLVIGPITIWNCDWWVIEIMIFDQWLVSDWNHHFSWSCKYLAGGELKKPKQAESQQAEASLNWNVAEKKHLLPYLSLLPSTF